MASAWALLPTGPMRIFRQLSWLLDLGGLTALAMVIAFGVSDVLATHLLDTGQVGLEHPMVQRQAERPGKATVDVGAALVERKPLNIDEQAPLVLAASPSRGPVVVAEPGPEPRVQRTKLGLSLVGTLVSPTDPSVRFANVMLPDLATRLVTVGSLVADGVTVLDVRQRVLLLREGVDITYVPLWNGQPAAPAKARAPRRKPTSPPVSAKPRIASKRGPAPRKLGPNHWQLNRSIIQAELKRSNAARGGRAVPNYKDGRFDGYRMTRPGGLGRALGLRPGDVIRSVNGRQINSPNVMIKLYQGLQSASELELGVERRGRLKSQRYSIQ